MLLAIFQASLIGHLKKADLLKNDTVYLEFGAGKGLFYNIQLIKLDFCFQGVVINQ